MVGLGPAQGEQHGGPLILGVLQQIFQLAQLVPADPKVREIVPLDIEFNTQVLGYAGEIFEGSGEMKERYFFFSEQHNAASFGIISTLYTLFPEKKRVL